MENNLELQEIEETVHKVGDIVWVDECDEVGTILSILEYNRYGEAYLYSVELHDEYKSVYEVNDSCLYAKSSRDIDWYIRELENKLVAIKKFNESGK